ncbi:MAG: imidazole glycerol phosphate synthase subunit HisH [Chitinophagales bacterium]|nr:imidazole glycerol phosphate synthase subunit HisH [Chitinophagales bacterium]MCZ2394026.1 imidazole glycerol phosphate synthase subunit HisH [Chitinophagales bacterium]
MFTQQNIVIVKYNGGNTHSVYEAINRLGIEAKITDDPDLIINADKIIFPGVGEAKSAMTYLKERELDKVLKSLTQPFLGICLGQQLMCSHSEEGDVECLGIFNAQVKKFQSNSLSLKIPQIGWNSIYDLKGELFKDIPEKSYVYFVHSYYVELVKETTASCDYIQAFSASLHKENFYSCQFHPEKSAGIGNQILQNFLQIEI